MRLFGLIGYPLTHSFSSNYFAEKFRKEKIENCSYTNFELSDINQLVALLDDHATLEGLNVTIPYKEPVMDFLHDRTEAVAEIGACNCIKITGRKLFGYNTDVFGFEKSLRTRIRPDDQRALVLGSGGAAKAVIFVLKKMGILYRLVSRQPANDGLSYNEVTPAIVAEHTLIINTTPLGMFPKTSALPPLPYESITPRHFLFDLIYNPARTLFLQKGYEHGATIQNGYDMLVYQAEESWKIWNEDFVA
jgi:shikimate dehydrogenase